MLVCWPQPYDRHGWKETENDLDHRKGITKKALFIHDEDLS